MPPASSNSKAVSSAQKSSDSGSSLMDWKVLIDNGHLSGGSLRQNLSVVSTEDPARQPPPSLATPAAGSASNLIPLYCGLLGALICGLVLWIVLKHARSRGRDSKLQHLKSPKSNLLQAADAAAAAPLTETAAPNSDEDDRDLPLAELDELRMKRLELALDCRAGWKDLAAEMGYGAETVAELESLARADSASPAGLLLRRYCEATAAATVGELRRLLTAAGQLDALRACQQQQPHKPRRHRQQISAAVTDSSCKPVELTTV